VAARLVGIPLSADEKISVHGDPIWRASADFIIQAPLSETGHFEQLWTKKMGCNQYEICCIPFFIYDVALGDLVDTAPQDGWQYLFRRVVKRSGRHVFRAFFDVSRYQHREATVRELHTLGAQVEWSSSGLLAIDARDQAQAQQVADYLQDREGRQWLVYETGRTASSRGDGNTVR
jgi:hypothetical protein